MYVSIIVNTTKVNLMLVQEERSRGHQDFVRNINTNVRVRLQLRYIKCKPLSLETKKSFIYLIAAFKDIGIYVPTPAKEDCLQLSEESALMVM